MAAAAAAAAAVVGTVAIGATSAQAGAAESDWSYYTVSGHQYYAFAYVNTSALRASATSSNGWNGGGTLSSYAGARGRLFNDNGVLVKEGSNLFNNCTGCRVGASSGSYYSSTSDAFRSWGVVYGYNTSTQSYNAFYTLKSPYQNT